VLLAGAGDRNANARGRRSLDAQRLNDPDLERELAGAASLVRATRWFGAIVLPAGAGWAITGLLSGTVSIVPMGLLALVFGAFLLLEASSSNGRPPASLAARLSTATLATAAGVVIVQPAIGPAIAIGTLIPVVLALPYVDRRTMNRLVAASALVGAICLAAPRVIPWAGPASGVAAFLPTSALIVVFSLFVLFLRNVSARLSDTASELRAVIEMSRDLSSTLDPQDVGNRLARHIALAAGADDCAISTWDREGDQVITFGYHPIDDVEHLDPAFDLANYPATRAVLLTQRPCIIDVNDPDADRAEVEYLRSIGQRSLIMLPLIARGQSIGIVELGATRPRAFHQRQSELAQMLVREAAITFDNVRLYDQLRDQAYRDSLTGLSNRPHFHDRVDHALDRVRGRSSLGVAVLFIDLDQFKLVNDQFGHTVGDRVLQVIADRIRAVIRPGDTPARLGGDEFAVLLEDVDGLEVANAVSRRLLDALAEPVELETAHSIVGGSIGIAVSGPGADTTDVLLRNADIAMYAAKADGRGQMVHFRQDLLELAFARSELAAMLRGAETRDELQLHFQPIVRLDDGAPVAMEALVRWQPEGHVLHMPAEFMGLAEETGEIVSIGRWVIGEACRLARAWQVRLRRPDLRLHVNLSARQFRDPGLVSLIERTLADSGLAPAALTLEVNESALLGEADETRDRIAELRDLGVRIAIDDFGTGYSSLGSLHSFQVNELKIDRSFAPVDERGDARVLSEAIVQVGRGMGLEMIAEGIETEAQAQWFRGLGCRLGQGFRYARPMPAAEVERFLRQASGEGQSQPKRRSATVATAASTSVRPTTT
jgi:diguanylate cyclase (GGDEF)-like protein